MRKYVVKDSFGLENLMQVEEEAPQPGPGQVSLKMKAMSLNYRDLLMVQGLYDPRQPLPVTPLSDGVGEVAAVGEGVTRAKEGDRVCPTFFQRWIKGEPDHDELRSTLGSPLDGALTEYMVIDEAGLVHPPQHLSDEEAAALPCAGVTAWTSLVTLGNIKAGDTVLVLGSGGESIFSLQFAKLHGADVIATTSSLWKMEKLKKLGATEVVNYKEDEGWGKTVRKMTGGRGVDHVVEVGGAGTLAQSLRAISFREKISLIGVLSGAAESLNILPIVMQGVTVQGIFVGHRTSFEDMNRAIETHQMKPVVDKVFSFGEAGEAFQYMKDGKHFGKICIKV